MERFSWSVCAACVEWERGLPSLPPAGPGLHLILREEDSAGGAGESLHILQACKEQKQGCSRGRVSLLVFVPNTLHQPRLCLLRLLQSWKILFSLKIITTHTLRNQTFHCWLVYHSRILCICAIFLSLRNKRNDLYFPKCKSEAVFW